MKLRLLSLVLIIWIYASYPTPGFSQSQLFPNVETCQHYLGMERKAFESTLKKFSIIENYEGQIITYRLKGRGDAADIRATYDKDENVVVAVSFAVGTDLAKLDQWDASFGKCGFRRTEEGQGMVTYENESAKQAGSIVMGPQGQISIKISKVVD